MKIVTDAVDIYWYITYMSISKWKKKCVIFKIFLLLVYHRHTRILCTSGYLSNWQHLTNLLPLFYQGKAIIGTDETFKI